VIRSISPNFASAVLREVTPDRPKTLSFWVDRRADGGGEGEICHGLHFRLFSSF